MFARAQKDPFAARRRRGATIAKESGQRPRPAPVIQAKLRVGAPKDEYEQEADRVAERVMRRPSPGVATPAIEEDQVPAIRRRCTGCRDEPQRQPVEGEDEEATPIRAKGEGGGPVELSRATASRIEGLNGRGQPLPARTRAYFEPRFRRDFSDVRVNHGADAADAAQAVRARAFTTENNIVFANGQYRPETTEGRRLLAHELTHVVQQCGSGRIKPACSGVQRARSDFQVRDRYTPAAGRLNNWAFFELAGSDLGPERARVEAFADTVTNPVTLYGYASEEGSSAFNATLINSRMKAVEAVLLSKGVSVSAKVPRQTVSTGLINYRRWRAVEVVEGATSEIPDCSVPGSGRRNFDAMESGIFFARRTSALNMVDKAISDLPAPSSAVHITRLFGPAAPLATISNNLGKIRGEISLMNSTRCKRGTFCYSSCAAGSIASFSPSGNFYTFCERYFRLSDANNQIRNIIHEASHGTPGLSTRDWAYRWERMIELLGTLDQTQALNNAGSYTLLVMLINGVSTVGGFPPPSDDYDIAMTAGPGGQREKTGHTVAYMQTWVTAARGHTAFLHKMINHRIGSPWPPSGGGREEMNATYLPFGLTPPSMPPRPRDQWRVAAIFDRYVRMLLAVGKKLKFKIASGGSTLWEPGPGTRVELHTTFFGKSLLRRIRLLLLRLATVVPGISAAYRWAYVHVADRLRRLKGVGP